MKGKVLVIEDNKNWQNLLKAYLEAADYFVETADDLEIAAKLVRDNIFHFITVDMQLDENTLQPSAFEGWNILQLIKKLGINQRTGIMIITGLENHYSSLKDRNKDKGFFLMPKSAFNKKEFIDTVDKSVAHFNLHFYNDKRDS